MSDPTITKKIPAVSKTDELEFYKKKFDEALAKMLKTPTKDNIDAFTKANANLYEVEDAYRIGKRLLYAYKVAVSRIRSRGLHTV